MSLYEDTDYTSLPDTTPEERVERWQKRDAINRLNDRRSDLVESIDNCKCCIQGNVKGHKLFSGPWEQFTLDQASMALINTHEETRALWKLVLEETHNHVEFSKVMCAFVHMICTERNAITMKVIGPPQVILGGDLSILTLKALWDIGLMPTGIDADFSKFTQPSWVEMIERYYGIFCDVVTIKVRAPAPENIDAARKALIELLHPYRMTKLKYVDFRPIASEELYTLCREREIEVEKEPLLLDNPLPGVHKE